MAIARLVITRSLTIAHAILQLPVLVGNGAQTFLDGAVQPTMAMIAVASASIIVARAVAVALLCSMHAMPRKVGVGFRRWAVLLGAVHAEVRPVAHARTHVGVGLVILFTPTLVITRDTVHQGALFHFAGFAVVQIVTCTATGMLVALAMAITLITPHRHSTLAHLVVSVLAVGHTPWEDRRPLP
jgi:hypothetical protein